MLPDPRRDGLLLGHYELGWRWWFWDPVENASLMPWIAGTALLHSTVVMEKRDALRSGRVLLAILTFSLSLIGTILVRSGHHLGAFLRHRPDPRRLHPGDPGPVHRRLADAVRVARAAAPAGGRLVRADLREGSLVLNNLFLVALRHRAGRHPLPAGAEMLTGEKITVGPPFFNSTFVPLAIPAADRARGAGNGLERGDVLAAAQASSPRWRWPWSSASWSWPSPGAARSWPGGDRPRRLSADRLRPGDRHPRPGLRGEPSPLARPDRAAPSACRARPGAPPSPMPVRGGAGHRRTGLGHRGLGDPQAGQTLATGPYTATLDRVAPRKGPNYEEAAAYLTIRTRAGDEVGQVDTGKRFYPSRKMAVTESGLLTIAPARSMRASARSGRTVASACASTTSRWSLLIWLGAVVMAVGGGLSLTDRRMRVGVPAKAKARRSPSRCRPNDGAPPLRPALAALAPGVASAHAVQPTRC